MQTSTTRSLLFAILGLLAGCAEAPVARTPSGLDWAQAPVARLRIAVGFFHPSHLDLQLGQPVRLIFDNGGGITHDFVTVFFSTVDQRPAAHAPKNFLANGRGPGNPVAGVRVVLQPAETIEYDIVPRQAGLYAVSSTLFSGVYVPSATIRVR